MYEYVVIICMYTVCLVSEGRENSVRSPEAGVPDGCELHVVAGTRTGSFGKQPGL